MENLSPSRIQPLSPGEGKASDDQRPRKPPAPQPTRAASSAALPPVDDFYEGAAHQLDERA